MAKILVVDDDRDVVQIVMDALARGNELLFATDGTGALHQVAEQHPDLVILDLWMPTMDGAILLGKIREASDVPVIVLSARHEQADVVGALDAGADDFIFKPFDLGDLEARVEAVLRRSTSTGSPHWYSSVVTVGPLVISPTRIATVDGRELHLTRTQHRILLLLGQFAEQVVSRTQFYAAVWQTYDPTLSKALDTHVWALRERLSDIPDAPTIATYRRRGFMLTARGAP